MRNLRQVLDEMRELPDFFGLELQSVKTRGHTGQTPLHVAAIQGDCEAVEILLDAGADPNAIGEYGYTPLHEAVEQGQLEIVRMLIDGGAKTTISDSDGMTPTELAKLLGSSDIQDFFATTERNRRA